MFSPRIKAGMFDIASGFYQHNIWLVLAWQDIKQRYRRSVIGPFWITISTGLMVLLMGPLYGALLNQSQGSYLQYLSVSMIIWAFISSYINESCVAFVSAEDYIKQVKLPLTVHLLRVMARNIFILLHNLLIVLVVLFIFPPNNLSTLYLMPLGVLIVLINLLWIGMLLAILCARFRDIPLLVTNLVMAGFFLSPILWKVDMLGNKRFLAELNPIYHFMQLIRTPLFGEVSAGRSWVVCGLMALIGCAITLVVFSRFRSRIVYWV